MEVGTGDRDVTVSRLTKSIAPVKFYARENSPVADALLCFKP